MYRYIEIERIDWLILEAYLILFLYGFICKSAC